MKPQLQTKLTRTEASSPPESLPATNRQERASRQRQKQKLIEATISALYAFGPSRTTVDRVVSIAEMSPGIVTFYFKSKDEMLLAALQHLADEFTEMVVKPIEAERDRPKQAIIHLIENYLAPELANSRKLAVWYSFWGEASARREYYEICGAVDQKLNELVLELMTKLALVEKNRHLDIQSLAMGLSGCMELIWQDIACMPSEKFDRNLALLRCFGYLSSVFPHSFPHGFLPGMVPLSDQLREARQHPTVIAFRSPQV
ncbi:MAG: TetR family transcriptional regulator [Alphaproteobacteria bacterium]|nr:TetR family transcriptional regulator [Alphaproteobacteria bacterium]